MSDIETQLRDYLDATVERVTAEDVLAGRRVYETVRPGKPTRTWRPAWVAVGTFAATVAVLGGTLVMGAVLTGPTGDLGSAGMSDVVHEATAMASDWWPLIAATALVIAVAGALIALRRRNGTHEEEDTMATTIDAPPAETTGTADHNNRGLIITIVVLAVALLALGAWAIYQQTAESETAAPAAVEELLVDYHEAWSDYDAEAILALTTEDFVFVNGPTTNDQAETAAIVSGGYLESIGFQAEHVGDPIVTGDGPYYAAVVIHQTITSGLNQDGISTFVVVDTADGLKVKSYVYTGPDTP